nr:lipid II flippase MurJ [Flaviflexus huanghaiensis]
MASAAGAAGVIAILTLLSRIVGFGRTVAESWVLGATPVADAYSTANNVPNVLFEVAAGGALAGVVVPLLSRCIARGDKDEANRTASALLTWVLAVGLPIALLVVVAAEPIAQGLLTSRDETVVGTAAVLLRIFAVQVPLYGLSVVFSGILQAHHRFVLPALAPMLSSVVVIGAFALFWLNGGAGEPDPASVPTRALMWLGWGTTGGVVAFSLPQLIPVLRLVSLRPTFRFPDGVGRQALSMTSAGFGGLLAQQTAIVLVMLVANNIGGEGSYPIFRYALALYFLPYAILAVPIATALFPRISKRAAVPGRVGLPGLVAGSIRLIVTVSAIGACALIAVAPAAQELFTVVYDMPELGDVVSVLALGVVGFSLLYHTSRVLYAVDCPGWALRVSLLGWGVAGLGVLVAVPVAGGRQTTLLILAAAVAVGMTMAGIAGVAAVRHMVGPAVTDGLPRTVVLIVAITSVSAFFGRLACDFILGLSEGILPAIGGGAAGAVVAAAVPVAVAYRADPTTWRVGAWSDHK